MKYILVLSLILLASCESVTPVKTEHADNSKLKIEILGNYDGCRIYRFYADGGHYFVRCSGSQTATLAPMSKQPDESIETK